MFYSENKKQYTAINRRTFFLYLFKLTFFSAVGFRLYNLQITDSKKYKTLSKNNQIKLELVYPLRGEIKDKKGKILAYNKRVYDLYIVPEQTINIEETMFNFL